MHVYMTISCEALLLRYVGGSTLPANRLQANSGHHLCGFRIEIGYRMLIGEESFCNVWETICPHEARNRVSARCI